MIFGRLESEKSKMDRTNPSQSRFLHSLYFSREIYMDFRTCLFCHVSVMLLSLAAFCLAEDPFISTRATNYHSPDGLGTPTGACGLLDDGKTINEARVSAVSKLYKGGQGCGICYQVRCKDPKYCCGCGTKVVVTDHGEGPETDFILSPKAYAGLARDNESAKVLFAKGVVDVEYRRIACGFSCGNIFSRIDKEHTNPNYFAILILYHGDKFYITEVKAIYMDQDGKNQSMLMRRAYMPLRRAYGAVWDLANPPKKFSLLLILRDDAGALNEPMEFKTVIRNTIGEWNALDTFTDHQLISTKPANKCVEV